MKADPVREALASLLAAVEIDYLRGESGDEYTDDEWLAAGRDREAEVRMKHIRAARKALAEPASPHLPSEPERAAFMVGIACRALREASEYSHEPVHYDEADCDYLCVADDLESAYGIDALPLPEGGES